MKTRMLGAVIGFGMMVALAGCSATGAAMGALHVGKNVAKKDAHFQLFLDGHEAAQNKMKKGIMGYAKYKVREPVSTSPTLRFSFEDPTKFGRITGTNLAIHQAFEADYSHQAEFVIAPAGDGPDSLMKPDTDYALGTCGGQFNVYDFDHNKVGGVTLKPGMDYMLNFTISGDRSETMQVVFSTK